MVMAPYWFWLLLIVLGVVGSLATLIGIVVTFFRELARGRLW